MFLLEEMQLFFFIFFSNVRIVKGRPQQLGLIRKQGKGIIRRKLKRCVIVVNGNCLFFSGFSHQCRWRPLVLSSLNGELRDNNLDVNSYGLPVNLRVDLQVTALPRSGSHRVITGFDLAGFAIKDFTLTHCQSGGGCCSSTASQTRFPDIHIQTVILQVPSFDL